jgi:hypothetical protein
LSHLHRFVISNQPSYSGQINSKCENRTDQRFLTFCCFQHLYVGGTPTTSKVTMVIKVKVQLPLYLIQHHAIKTHDGVDVLFHAFLTSNQMKVNGQFTPPTALPSVSTGQQSGWALDPVWTHWRTENCMPVPEIESLSSSPRPLTVVTKASCSW